MVTEQPVETLAHRARSPSARGSHLGVATIVRCRTNTQSCGRAKASGRSRLTCFAISVWRSGRRCWGSSSFSCFQTDSRVLPLGSVSQVRSGFVRRIPPAVGVGLHRRILSDSPASASLPPTEFSRTRADEPLARQNLDLHSNLHRQWDRKPEPVSASEVAALHKAPPQFARIAQIQTKSQFRHRRIIAD